MPLSAVSIITQLLRKIFPTFYQPFDGKKPYFLQNKFGKQLCFTKIAENNRKFIPVENSKHFVNSLGNGLQKGKRVHIIKPTLQKGGSMRNFLRRLQAGLRHFMLGRYGTDKLNMAILSAGVILSVLVMLISNPLLDGILTLIAYGLMIWAIFRMLSRNTYKRYQENRKYLRFLERIKDREHRYFDCPRCHQSVRVPRGKGKISITCPKCKEKFIKKT